MNLNKVFVLGNLTREPEKRNLPSGQSVVNFGVATNRFYSTPDKGKQQDTEFHNVVLFGKVADIASQYLNKGSLVLIEGRLKTRTWEDKNNPGVRRYKTEIIGERLQLGPKGQSSSAGQKSYEGGQNQSGQSGQSGQTETSDEDIPTIDDSDESEGEIDVKDIPF